MKIAFVHHSFQLGNGTDTLVYQYAKRLFAKGHEVSVYTLRLGGFGFSDGFKEVDIQSHHVGRVVMTKLPFGNGHLNTSVFAPFYKEFWQVRKELEAYDCIISMIYPSCLLPVWPEKLKTKVIHIEWGTPEGVWSTFQERMYSTLAKTCQGISCAKADEVLTPGSFAQRWVVDNYGIDSRKMYLDGVDFEMMGRSKVELRYDTKNILYVGRIAPYKGIDTLIKAFKVVKSYIPDATLTLIGARTFPGYFNRLGKLVEELSLTQSSGPGLGINRDIEWCGVVPQSGLPEYYSQCQVYCSASKWEGFLKSDAYAFAKPMVALDLTSAKDIIQPNITGKLVPQGSLADIDYVLGMDLTYLLEKPEECKRLGENGYQWAKENLDLDKIVDNLERVIKE